MKKIDVMELAKSLDDELIPEFRKNMEEFADSVNGKPMDTNEILMKVVAPMIGMSNTANRIYTIELIQKVVDELRDSEND